MLGLAVMGYHPGIEDDGVYLTAVKYKLNPALYPHDSAFFRFQMQASFFDNWVAGFVRWTGIPLAYTELLWQLASIAFIVSGRWTLARRLSPEARSCWWRRGWWPWNPPGSSTGAPWVCLIAATTRR